MKKKKIQTLRVSLHGHSPESDGLTPIPELVEAAGKSNIHFFGLADHETTAGIPSLYREVSSFNRTHDHQIQAACGFEIQFGDSGDVVFSKPGSLDPAFLAWGEQVIAKRNTYPTVRAMNEAVRRFSALVIIPHVSTPFTHSISVSRLATIVKKLTPQVRSHLALEVRNYATQLFWIHTVARELSLDRIAGEFGLAKVGSSDFHQAWMVKKQVSTFTGQISAKSLKKAIRTGSIKPAYTPMLALREWIALIWTMGLAFVRSKRNNWNFSFPYLGQEPQTVFKFK